MSDPHHDATAGAAAVFFEPELTLEGVVDGLDALAEPAQLAVALPLTTAIGPDQRGAELADEVLELPAGIPLVRDDEQAGPERRPRRSEHCAGDFPIAQLGGGQAPEHHRPVRGGEQVEAEAPEVARVGRSSSRSRPIRRARSARPSPERRRRGPVSSRGAGTDPTRRG